MKLELIINIYNFSIIQGVFRKQFNLIIILAPQYLLCTFHDDFRGGVAGT